MQLLKPIFNGAMAIFGLAVMFTIFQLMFTYFEGFKKEQKTKKGNKPFKIRGLKRFNKMGGFMFENDQGDVVLKKGKKGFQWQLQESARKVLTFSNKTLEKLGYTKGKDDKKINNKLDKIRKKIAGNEKKHGIHIKHTKKATSLALSGKALKKKIKELAKNKKLQERRAKSGPKCTKMDRALYVERDGNCNTSIIDKSKEEKDEICKKEKCFTDKYRDGKCRKDCAWP